MNHNDSTFEAMPAFNPNAAHECRPKLSSESSYQDDFISEIIKHEERSLPTLPQPIVKDDFTSTQSDTSLFDGMSQDVAEAIKDSMFMAAGLGPTGVMLPCADTVGVTAIWGTMLYNIAKAHGTSLSLEDCTKIIAACASGIVTYLTASKALSWALNFIPIPIGGTLVAMAGNTAANAYYTYAVGRGFNSILSKPGFGGLLKMGFGEIAKKLVSEIVFVPGVKLLIKVLRTIRPSNF